MGVNLYLSTDASAPVLDGTVGSLVNVFDKCLCDGYGAKSPLGWGKPFTATNQRAYRAASGNRMYLQVDDNGDSVAGAFGARTTAWESMSALGTGEGRFFNNTSYGILKSYNADSFVRSWMLVGDERLFYFVNDVFGSTRQSAFAFGEFLSYIPSDPYATLIIHQALNATAATMLANNDFGLISSYGAVPSGSKVIPAGHWMARAFPFLPGAISFGKVGHVASTSSDDMGGSWTGAWAYPSPAGNRLIVAKDLILVEQLGVLNECTPRGVLPGLCYPLHKFPLSHLERVPNVPGLGGRDVICAHLPAGASSGSAAQCLFDITGPWR